MTTTTAPARATGPRRSALDHATAMRLAADEYGRFVSACRELDAEDWRKETANAGWTVRDMAGHALGMMKFARSLPEQLRQTRAAKRHSGVFIDALTALQVEEHRALTVDQLLDELTAAAPRAARGRRRTPGFVRSRALPEPQPTGEGGALERWTIGYLVDTILTRDPWMHRSDLALATGRAMVLTPDHDGAIVADVVREWMSRHGRSCTLTLTGPAGGTWGSGGETLELDAVQFCRILSGRGTGEGLLGVAVPF